jgi:hypothetical protein
MVERLSTVAESVMAKANVKYDPFLLRLLVLASNPAKTKTYIPLLRSHGIGISNFEDLCRYLLLQGFNLCDPVNTKEDEDDDDDIIHIKKGGYYGKVKELSHCQKYHSRLAMRKYLYIIGECKEIRCGAVAPPED